MFENNESADMCFYFKVHYDYVIRLEDLAVCIVWNDACILLVMLVIQ